ncbi:MAG TPA: ATP-binding protein [bacterium]|jgi:serine/threonine-protein kinase RsbW
MSQTAHPERIELTIPGRPEYVAVVRLAAAAIAGRMSFTFDEIEDLKVAVGEVCSSAILTGTPRLLIAFDVRPQQLDIAVTHSPGQAPRAKREQDLDKLLVQVLMDDVVITNDGAEHVTRMSKRLAKS